MPELVNSSVGSLPGTSGAEGERGSARAHAKNQATPAVSRRRWRGVLRNGLTSLTFELLLQRLGKLRLYVRMGLEGKSRCIIEPISIPGELLMSLPLDQQVALLVQGAEYGDEQLAKAMEAELRAKLAEGRPLRVYCGYDPRTADLHLGHTITMRKLRQFQELGHQVVFLVGTYTSLIGDPSDKDQLRPQLTPEQVEENARTYARQAFKILDPEKTVIRYNAEWLPQ